MKLNFDYNNRRGHFEVDLTKFFPNTKGNTKRMLEVFQLSEDAYELAEKAHGYLVETVKTLQADRAEARLKNDQKKVVSITTEIKKLLSCADVFSSEYGFEVLTDADAESQKMKKVDVYALRTNENGESEIKVVSGYEFKKGGYTFHVYKEKLSKTSRIHIIFPSCGAAVNSNIESIKTFKDSPEFITEKILMMIDNFVKSDKYKQMTDNFRNNMEKSGYEITEDLKPIQVLETKIKIKKEGNKETVNFKERENTMKDKNGVQIKAGDIVRIEGAFFKNDNGLYYVEQDGTNKAYCGRDSLTLYKICKNGKLSTAQYNICFFPIHSTVSDHVKTAQANAWNKEHATIEVVYNVDNSKVIERFEEEARQAKEASDYYKLRGYSESFTKCYDDSFEYYCAAAERMKAEKEQPKEEEKPLNSMCLNCACLGNDCAGSHIQVFTGCIYKQVKTEETAQKPQEEPETMADDMNTTAEVKELEKSTEKAQEESNNKMTVDIAKWDISPWERKSKIPLFCLTDEEIVEMAENQTKTNKENDCVVATYTQTTTGERIAISKYNNGYYYITFSYGSNCDCHLSTKFETLEDAEKTVYGFRPHTVRDGEPKEEQNAETANTTTAEPPTDNYFIENMETGKIELHFEKSAYMALTEEQKKEIKSNFLFSRYSSAWVSRCKFPHTYRAKEIAKKLGLADGGKTGESLSFEKQQEIKANKAERRAERMEYRAEKAQERGEHLQKPINDMHGDIAFFTQPNINSSAGRAFTRRREKMWAAWESGFNEFKKSDYYKERAEQARQTAQQTRPTDKGFIQRRIDDAEKIIKVQKKNIKEYEDILSRIENGETVKMWNGNPYTVEKLTEYIEHHNRILEDAMSKAIYYYERMEEVGGVAFNKSNVKKGCYAIIDRWGKVEVIGTGSKNITYRILTGGAAGFGGKASYAEIKEIIKE